jgi:hypothetical protein
MPASALATQERFWSKVGHLPRPDDCWPWVGSRSRNGYGQFYENKRTRWAHRIAYRLLRGPIPAELTIDHLCKNKACCNPYHMEVVTQRENLMRAESRSAINARKTHCPSGHPYDSVWKGNAYGTRRGCSVCNRARANASYRTLRNRCGEVTYP